VRPWGERRRGVGRCRRHVDKAQSQPGTRRCGQHGTSGVCDIDYNVGTIVQHCAAGAPALTGCTAPYSIRTPSRRSGAPCMREQAGAWLSQLRANNSPLHLEHETLKVSRPDATESPVPVAVAAALRSTAQPRLVYRCRPVHALVVDAATGRALSGWPRCDGVGPRSGVCLCVVRSSSSHAPPRGE
jgi:hypothetical protein